MSRRQCAGGIWFQLRARQPYLNARKIRLAVCSAATAVQNYGECVDRTRPHSSDSKWIDEVLQFQAYLAMTWRTVESAVNECRWALLMSCDGRVFGDKYRLCLVDCLSRARPRKSVQCVPTRLLTRIEELVERSDSAPAERRRYIYGKCGRLNRGQAKVRQ